MHPRVLVLDEPTSALDPTAAEDVLATLTRLVHDLGLTVLLAEHRLERVVPFADRLVPAHRRRPACRSATPAEMLAHSPVVPPIVELGRAAGWQPLPLTRARRRARRARGARAGRRHRPSPRRARRRRRGSRPTRRHRALRPHGRACARSTSTLARRRGHRADGPQRLRQVDACSGRCRARGARDARARVRRRPAVDPAALDAAGRRALVGLVPQTAADLLYLETVADGVRRRRRGAGAARHVPRAAGPARPRHRPATSTRATSPRASGWPWCWRSCWPRGRRCCCSTSRRAGSTTPPRRAGRDPARPGRRRARGARRDPRRRVRGARSPTTWW